MCVNITYVTVFLMYVHKHTYMFEFIYIPLQVTPSMSNRNPLLHSQLKPPSVFVHVWEQLSVKLLHSSISKERNCFHECMRVYICVYVCVCVFVFGV